MTTTVFQVTADEAFVASALGVKPLAPGFPLCYPFIILKDDGGQTRKLFLSEAVQEVSGALPAPSSNGSKETIYQQFLHSPLRPLLQQFVIPSREAVADKENTISELGQELEASKAAAVRKVKTIELLKVELESSQETAKKLREQNVRLLQIVRRFGKGKGSEFDISVAMEAAGAFLDFFDRFPDSGTKSRIVNSLRRAGQVDLAEIRKMLSAKGRIRSVRGINEVGEQFLVKAFGITQQEASH